MAISRVCHITTVHKHNDMRIFEKECKTLRDASYEVGLICTNTYKHEEDQIKIHSIKLNSKFRITRIVALQFKILTKALSEKYKVYHFHDPELIATGLILKLFGKKVIYDVHEDLPLQIFRKPYIAKKLAKPLSKLVNFIEKNSARAFDQIICVTSSIENKFKNYNKHTSVLRNFPIVGMFTRGIEAKKRRVCYAGGLSGVRGLYKMLEASEKSSIPIYLAGSFSIKKDELLMGNNELFNYLGYLGKEDVNELYASSMAGLVILEDVEAFRFALPVKMFEYMLSGTPVICSDFPLWREIIEKYDCGICVDQNDSQAIADALIYLSEHPEEVDRMGNNGRNAILNDLNWGKESENLLKAYKEVLMP